MLDSLFTRISKGGLMKRFIMKLLLFAALFIFADVVLGAILSNLRDNVQYGRIRRIRYIAEEQQTE